MKTSVVILAAGLGTRMRSKQAKVLHRAGGLSLVEHVVLAAGAVTSRDRIVVVTGHQADTVEDLLQPMGVRFARQVQQKGSRDQARVLGRTVYLHTPDGYPRSELRRVLARAGGPTSAAVAGTARNWATVSRLAELCGP